MKTILIHSAYTSNSQMFNANEKDEQDFSAVKSNRDKSLLEGSLTRINDPAIYLRERLFECGYRLKSADDNPITDCEWVFFYDSLSVIPYSSWRGMARKIKSIIMGRPLIRNLYGECIRAEFGKRMALFLWEAPAVSPENMDPKLHKLFPVIFTSHDELVDNKKFFKVCVPQMRQFPKLPEIKFDQKKLLVNISMNKYSNHPHELYSARRTAIKYFEKAHPDNFDLYGLKWDELKFKEKLFPWLRYSYKSYRGAVKNKWEVMHKYKFSICYENVRDVSGYVTEKIFDSMRSGCVPIYWGANNINDYVDPEAFIDRRNFKSDAELDQFISGMTEREYMRYQVAIKKYLDSPRFERFLPKAFADTIIDVLKL